jgi:hypothetical protein
LKAWFSILQSIFLKMERFTTILAAASAIGAVTADKFNILQHVGGNGQWFPGESSKTTAAYLADSHRARGDWHLI